MKSIRLRLLFLALLPLVVLLPLLLGIGMNRWSTSYDTLLNSKVESDLRIAEQYLQRILTNTGNGVQGLAKSAEIIVQARDGPTVLAGFLTSHRKDLGLDFLYFKATQDLSKDSREWPVIQAAINGISRTEIDIFSGADLSQLSPKLAQQASIPLVATEAAVPTDRNVEDRGMVVHTATPLNLNGVKGVLVGGTLLNRNLDFIDTINDLVYLSSSSTGSRQGTATLFLEDVRISTNVRLFEDVRALGTRVSAIVRNTVLDQGQTWLDRAFVVNDWYISGYLPITDSFGTRAGMLYVGFREAPFKATKRAAYMSIFAGLLLVLALSVPLFLRMARGIFKPLESMTKTMKQVEDGDLTARIGETGTQDEIGQVALHLDTLLDQVQERDHALRSWADELNERVDQRTAELKQANKKLEETFQQLVMSEKLASIGEVTAGVAHEINNPVAVIQGNVDVMREILAEKSQMVQTELSLIDQQVHRIDTIVGKLLQFARPSEYGTFDENVDLNLLLEDCLVLVDHVIKKENCTIDKKVNSSRPVHINPGELQQVIVNLIINATQAMGPDGILTLRVGSKTHNGQSGSYLSVGDSGPGIPASNLSSVFDPFFTTKLGEGTGLGLSISQTLIQRAGGIIIASNKPDSGALFMVWLPEVITMAQEISQAGE